MGIPPSSDWVAYCVDEALHILAAGHTARDLRWDERFRKSGDDGDLFDKIMDDPRTGKPPSVAEIAMLPSLN